MNFASRTNWELAANSLAERRRTLEKANFRIADLTESNPTRCGLATLTAADLQPLSDEGNLVYTPDARGLERARWDVVAYYRSNGVGIDPERIVLTASTSEAYSYIFRLLCNPGQAIAVPSPGYPLFDVLGDMNDIKRLRYPLAYDDRWGIPGSGVNAECSHADAKAVVLVNPNNPTGNYVSAAEYGEVQAIAATNRLAVIVDEVFHDYPLDGSATPPPSTLTMEPEALTFTLGGLSKAFGMPQMKLGWMVVGGPAEVVDAALRRLDVIADTYLSVNAPVQTALRSWLPLRPAIQREILERTVANLDGLRQRFPPGGAAECLHVEGGWSAVLRLPQVMTDSEWAATLLERDQVLVDPGEFYSFAAHRAHVVLSLLPQRSVFTPSIDAIVRRVADQTA